MVQKRLSIDLSEILHLEVYCEGCKTSSSLPIESRTGGIPVSHNLMETEFRCPLCMKEFRTVPDFPRALDQLRQGLSLYRKYRKNSSPFQLRLIVQK